MRTICAHGAKGRNEADRLHSLLQHGALHRRLHPRPVGSDPPDELLVIDDGSSDNSVELASRWPVRVIRHGKNKGLAATRNTAFANATHPFIGAIDADVLPDPTWLEHLLTHFADPRVVGTSGRLIEANHSRPADAWRAIHMTQDLGLERIDIEPPSYRRLGGFGTRYSAKRQS